MNAGMLARNKTVIAVLTLVKYKFIRVGFVRALNILRVYPLPAKTQ